MTNIPGIAAGIGALIARFEKRITNGINLLPFFMSLSN